MRSSIGSNLCMTVLHVYFHVLLHSVQVMILSLAWHDLFVVAMLCLFMFQTCGKWLCIWLLRYAALRNTSPETRQKKSLPRSCLRLETWVDNFIRCTVEKRHVLMVLLDSSIVMHIHTFGEMCPHSVLSGYHTHRTVSTISRLGFVD